MTDKLKQATEGQELAWATSVTKNINQLAETCKNLAHACDLLRIRIEKLEAGTTTNPKPEVQ